MTHTTDGLIYAQPLYIHGLDNGGHVGICSSPANIVFVATENNSVYAFDTSPPFAANPCWKLNLNQTNEAAIPYTALPQGANGPCSNLIPQVGITGTPVIDVTVTPPILYVVSSHQKGTGPGATFIERLHAIDTTTGLELTGNGIPFDVGNALGSNFNIVDQNQRPGLALAHPSGSPNLANVYVGWASNCDFGNYEGWAAGFQLNYSSQANGFSLLGKFTSELPTGHGNQGGIWMAGSAPAIDSNGNVYLAVANGSVHPPSQTSLEWGNSVLKLSSSLAYEDFYTVNDWLQLDGGGSVCFTGPPCSESHPLAPDTDMGTGGVVLLSSAQLVSIGKQGMLYLIHHDTSTGSSTAMGGLDGCGYNCSRGSDPTLMACSAGTGLGTIVQCFKATAFTNNSNDNGVRGAPVFWSGGGQNQYAFPIGVGDFMYWYQYSSTSGMFDITNPPQSDHQFKKRGGTGGVAGAASATWNGSNVGTGVVWALDSNGFGTLTQASSPVELFAYPAVPSNPNCGVNDAQICELWDSTELPNSSIVMPGSVKFTVPTIVDGYILVGGGSPGYFGSSSTACPPPGTAPPFTCAGQLTILH